MTTLFPKAIEKLEIQAFKAPKDPKTLRKTHVPFSGSPHPHPYDAERIILVADPYSSNITYYEFKMADIAIVEDLPHLVDPDGETVPMARIWIRKGCLAVRSTPFIVEDTRTL